MVVSDVFEFSLVCRTGGPRGELFIIMLRRLGVETVTASRHRTEDVSTLGKDVGEGALRRNVRGRPGVRPCVRLSLRSRAEREDGPVHSKPQTEVLRVHPFRLWGYGSL